MYTICASSGCACRCVGEYSVKVMGIKAYGISGQSIDLHVLFMCVLSLSAMQCVHIRFLCALSEVWCYLRVFHNQVDWWKWYTICS